MKKYLLSLFFLGAFLACNRPDYSATLNGITELRTVIEAYEKEVKSVYSSDLERNLKELQIFTQLVKDSLDAAKAQKNKNIVMFMDEHTCLEQTAYKYQLKMEKMISKLEDIKSRLNHLETDIVNDKVKAFDSLAQLKKMALNELTLSFVEEEKLKVKEQKAGFEKRIIGLKYCNEIFENNGDSLMYYFNLIRK